MRRFALRALLLLCAAAAIGGFPAAAGAANGDFVGQVTFSQDCGSGLGVGVTYDGAGHLWVSCYASSPDLLRADATTGVVDQTYTISSGLGALAYDATRNAIWAGPGCGATGDVQLITLDATKTVTGSSTVFTPTLTDCLDDGIAYDAGDDTLYYSPDGSTSIAHHKTDGTLLDTFSWTGSGCYNSGLAIGGSLLFQGSDGCSHVWVVDKTTLAPAFDFDTAVTGDPNFRDEGLSCDTDTFSALGKQVMWSKEAYSPNRAAAFEIPAGTCGVGGQPAAEKTLTLGPTDVTNHVGTQHTVTANLSDTSGPTADATILFSVGGANTATGSGTTDASGDASFTYTGTNAGDDTITACYDANGSGVCDPDEPTATATKHWVDSSPVCTAAAVSGPSLWPPNHRMVWMSIGGVTDPDGDPITIAITSIRQDEPTNGLGDGDTAVDGIIGSGNSFAVRAERSGKGDGRVYHVSFTASDGLGGSCSGSATVGIPHDLGPGGGPIDGGSLYDSTH